MEVSDIKKHGGFRRGAGRPKTEPTVRVRVPVSLEKPFHDWLKEAMEDVGVQRVRTAPGKAEEAEGDLESKGQRTKGARRA